MLIYPKDIEDRLGITSLMIIARSKAKSPHGLEFFDRAKPTASFDNILKWLNQTHEMLRILHSGDQLPSREFEDLRPLIKRLTVKGSFLAGEDLLLLRHLLIMLYEWTRYLKKDQTAYPELCELTYGFIADLTFPDLITQIIDDRGEVRDNASPELKAIRALLTQKEKAVRTVINNVLKKARQDKLTDEDSQVTVRDGRLVIPLHAEHKRRIQGFVHDESATGHTVYLEPTEALQLNNEVRELQYQERREIARILTRVADQIRQSLPDLERGAQFLGILDFIHAKAVFADEIEAVMPQVKQGPLIKWYQARHPLLWLSHEASGKPTVPLSVELQENDSRILVISGPNAGGKSVALKTIGLIQYMLQSGFLVPVGEASEFGVFEKLLLDIGDTQSLENDLSTYSSHLNSMKFFCEHVDDQSLFLIDEFGTGTEPQFGGAIAESILAELTGKKAFGVVTTHYQNLKKFSQETAGVINGAMKFDGAALEPLYELEVGKPGSSFAFEIAAKIGLPSHVLGSAKSLVGEEKVSYERLLNELERNRARYEKLVAKVERDEKDLTQLRSDYESLKKMVAEEKSRILGQAKAEARQIIQSANRQIEQTIREIKEHKADREKTRQAREKLERLKKESEASPAKGPGKKTSKEELIAVGDPVVLAGQETVGEVMSMKGKQVQVRFGNLISFVDVDKLRKSKAQPKSAEPRRRVGGINMVDKMSQFSGELSVIGLYPEEALGKVDEFVDQALMLGVDNVRIVHGKGHGVLREVLRNHLKGHPGVEAMEDEHIEFGGSGITVVKFR